MLLICRKRHIPAESPLLSKPLMALRNVPKTSANGFHCLSFSFVFFPETRLFKGLRRLRAGKMFLLLRARMSEGHASQFARLKPAHLILGQASRFVVPMRRILRELREIA
jgi:hypothetical protein